MGLVKWFILAIQFSTIFPTPVVHHATESDIRKSVVFFPIVGVLLGGILWGVQIVLTRHMPNLAATAVSLTIYTISTGALHLDGLMDTADAIGSRRPRADALHIMKDSRIGAMGAIAAVLVLVGKLSAISSLAPEHFAPFIVVPMLSRLGMVWSMQLYPSARSEGLGWLFARRIPAFVVAVATIASALVCILSLSAWSCLWVLIYFVTCVSLFNWWMFHRFGGTTGDTYGAVNEILEWLGWLVLAGINQ